MELNTKFPLFPPSIFLYLVLACRVSWWSLRWLVKTLLKQLAYPTISAKYSCSYFSFRGALLLWIAIRKMMNYGSGMREFPLLVRSLAPGFLLSVIRCDAYCLAVFASIHSNISFGGQQPQIVRMLQELNFITQGLSYLHSVMYVS